RLSYYISPDPNTSTRPSTTLFRSHHQGKRQTDPTTGDREQTQSHRNQQEQPHRATPGSPTVHQLSGPGGQKGRHGKTRTDRTTQDRKSTRLNSSHVSISYAVFCYK